MIRRLLKWSTYAHKVTRLALEGGPHSATCTCGWSGSYQTKAELDKAIANHAGWTL
jgi:hypothetical protein